MEFLVYRSRALVAPNSAQADDIVSTSVSRNTRDGLTGFLHHEPNLFIHYLEGPPVNLRQIWARIVADPRNEGATVIGKGLISNRFFEGWRMGYSNGDVARFVDFLQEAAGKSVVADATAREAIWFLRGACQRLDLGLVH